MEMLEGDLYEWYTVNYTGNFTDYPMFDYSEHKPQLVITRDFLICAIFYGLVFLIGVIGNCLVIFCVRRYKRMQNITNQLLLSLACADLILTVICIPIKFAELFSFTWKFGEALCKLTHYIQNWSMVTSVTTLVVISLERYYAIAKPLRAKYLCTTKHARFVIAGIWVISAILSLPTYFVMTHYPLEVGDLYYCIENWDEKGVLVAVLYEVYMLIILFLMPVIIMICAYGGLCMQLWAVTSNQCSYTSLSSKNKAHSPVEVQTEAGKKITDSKKSKTDSKTQYHYSSVKTHHREHQIKKQVINMLITVVTIFIVCWGPYLSYNLVLAAGVIKPWQPLMYPYHKDLEMAFSLLAYSNSCINPLIYGFMSTYFRKSFKQALSACFWRRHRTSSRYTPPTTVQRCYNGGRGRLTSTDYAGTNQKRMSDTATASSTLTTLNNSSTLNSSPPTSPSNTCPRMPPFEEQTEQ